MQGALNRAVTLTGGDHVVDAWLTLWSDAVLCHTGQCSIGQRVLRSICGDRGGAVHGERGKLAGGLTTGRVQGPPKCETMRGLSVHLTTDSDLLIAGYAVLVLLTFAADRCDWE